MAVEVVLGVTRASIGMDESGSENGTDKVHTAASGPWNACEWRNDDWNREGGIYGSDVCKYRCLDAG